MGLPSYLLRRGAIYYWRRRLPRAHGGGRKAHHVLLSLGTPVLARARLLAAHLTVIAEAMFRNAAMLSEQQINEVFRHALHAHVHKLEQVVAVESSDADFDWRESARISDQWYWVYRMRVMRGRDAEIDDEAASQMRAAGVAEEDIFTVALRLQQLRQNGMNQTPWNKLESLLAAVGAAPTDANIAAAQQAYFRALSEGCAISARRQREGRSDDRARAEAILLREAQTTQYPPAAMLLDPCLSAEVPMAPRVSTQPTAPQPYTFEDHPVWLIAQNLAVHMEQHELRRASGRKQLLQTCRLFVLLLLKRGVYSIETLQQQDFSAYVELLGELAKTYGKSERDRTRTLEQLREIGRSKPKDLRGLKARTVNKHVTALSGLVDHMRGKSLPVRSDIDPSRLRVSDKKRARNRTQSANPNRLEVMFQLSPFTGCASAEEPFTRGSEIYHCANYFVPQLLYYYGGRREELCGLRVAEVIFDTTVPYLEIVPNAYRDLKNSSSDRALPCHPELLRLQFREYVQAIKDLGYDLVFPELRWGDSTMPLGDRFYKNFVEGLRLIREAKIERPSDPNMPRRFGPEQPFIFRQLRKSFGAELKRKGVHSGERADLMGHTGANVNEEVYVDPIELQRALELMEKIPIVTAHLLPQQINLLPWVRDKLPPPDARRRRREKRLQAPKTRC